MLHKNQSITLKITDLSHQGSGVGHHEGMAVFVPLTAPGDEIMAKIVNVQKQYAFGIIEEFIQSSPLRQENHCPVFARCGGCSLRHITYQGECAYKSRWVTETLARIGGIAPEQEAIIPSPAWERYRNKAQYPVRKVGERIRTGFFAPRSHQIAPVEDCLLQPAFFADICCVLCAFMEERGISAYEEASHQGLVRHLYLRHAETTGQTLICLVINGTSIPGERELADRLAACCPGAAHISVSRNRRKDNVIIGESIRVVLGEERILDTVCGIQITLSPHSFYQVNRQAAELLYQTALAYTAPRREDTILDLYCGAGAIGLTMAAGAKEVIGVETVPQAVEDARENAHRNGITNARFLCMDAAEASAKLREENLRPDIVVVDPPRKGVEQSALEHIAAMEPSRIVYVSCNPATLARDCKILAELGYKATRARPVDLFPRTSHVEAVCLLERKTVENG